MSRILGHGSRNLGIPASLFEFGRTVSDPLLEGLVCRLQARVEPRVLDGGSDLDGEQLEEPEPFLREGVPRERVLQIQQSDQLALVHERLAQQRLDPLGLDVRVCTERLVFSRAPEHHRLMRPSDEIHHRNSETSVGV